MAAITVVSFHIRTCKYNSIFTYCKYSNCLPCVKLIAFFLTDFISTDEEPFYTGILKLLVSETLLGEYVCKYQKKSLATLIFTIIG